MNAPRLTRVGKRNQVTIPAEILRDLEIVPGGHVEVSEEGGEIRIRKAQDPIDRAYGLLHRPGRAALTIEELNREARKEREEAAWARYRRADESG